MAAIMKNILSSSTMRRNLLSSSSSVISSSKDYFKRFSSSISSKYPCYVCDGSFDEYKDIRKHIKVYDCILRDPLYPPSRKVPDPTVDPNVYWPGYKNCLPDQVYLVYVAQDTRHLVHMLERHPGKVFVIYVDAPERARSLETTLKCCFQHCLHVHSFMTMSSRNRLLKAVRDGHVRTLITTPNLEEGCLDIGKVDFIIHFDFSFPSLPLFMKMTLTQFGVPTQGVVLYHPIQVSNSSSLVPFEDPLKVVSRSIKIENNLAGNFHGKRGQTLKYFGRHAGVKFNIVPGPEAITVEVIGHSIAITKALILITRVLAKAVSVNASRSSSQVKQIMMRGLGRPSFLLKTGSPLGLVEIISKAQDVGWPAIPSFRKNTMATTNPYVKVSMDGAPYMKTVDLKIYSNYMELSSALEKMFSCTIGQCSSHGVPGREGMTESQLIDLLHGSEYVLTYEDKYSDWMLIRDVPWMLVGDVPWDLFTHSCGRLRIMKGSDAIGLVKYAK